MNFDLTTVIVLIVLMLICYTIRGFLYIRQANSILDELRRIKRIWKNHAMGRGSYRLKKSVVLIGADEDLIIREACYLNGITVFARMKPHAKLLGLSVSALAKQKEEKPPKGISGATWRAACEASKYIIDYYEKKAAEEAEMREESEGVTEFVNDENPATNQDN